MNGDWSTQLHKQRTSLIFLCTTADSITIIPFFEEPPHSPKHFCIQEQVATRQVTQVCEVSSLFTGSIKTNRVPAVRAQEKVNLDAPVSCQSLVLMVQGKVPTNSTMSLFVIHWWRYKKVGAHWNSKGFLRATSRTPRRWRQHVVSLIRAAQNNCKLMSFLFERNKCKKWHPTSLLRCDPSPL